MSAVSTELRSARQAVARTVRTLGYDPVSQDDFPTGYGELRQWLREQIDGVRNAALTAGELEAACPLEPGAGDLLAAAFERLGLSARAHARILKVARTIADLAGTGRISASQVAEAIQQAGESDHWTPYNTNLQRFIYRHSAAEDKPAEGAQIRILFSLRLAGSLMNSTP
mgnify:CR=1 FL=1